MDQFPREQLPVPAMFCWCWGLSQGWGHSLLPRKAGGGQWLQQSGGGCGAGGVLWENGVRP